MAERASSTSTITVSVDAGRSIEIPRKRLRFSWVRSRGPGGQNVNKVATRAVLVFDLLGCELLDEEERWRAIAKLGKRVNQRGEFFLSCDEHRSREANRRTVVIRFVTLLEEALRRPKRRRRTRVSARVRRHRLEAKRRRGETKRGRKRVEE